MSARTTPALAERHHPATADCLNRADQVICAASNSLGPQPSPAAETSLTRIADAPSETESRLEDQDPHKSPQPAPGDPAVPRAAASHQEGTGGTVPWRIRWHGRPGGDGRRRQTDCWRNGRQPQRATAELIRQVRPSSASRAYAAATRVAALVRPWPVPEISPSAWRQVAEQVKTGSCGGPAAVTAKPRLVIAPTCARSLSWESGLGRDQGQGGELTGRLLTRAPSRCPVTGCPSTVRAARR